MLWAGFQALAKPNPQTRRFQHGRPKIHHEQDSPTTMGPHGDMGFPPAAGPQLYNSPPPHQSTITTTISNYQYQSANLNVNNFGTIAVNPAPKCIPQNGIKNFLQISTTRASNSPHRRSLKQKPKTAQNFSGQPKIL